MNSNTYLDVSIIIVNYKSEKYLKTCIESIFKNSSAIKFEIIIIDNGSVNKIEKIVENFQNVKLVKNKKNFGFSFAINQGIKICKGKYVLLLNPDTETINDALNKMIKFLNENEDVGIVGPLVYESDGNTIQLSCRSFPSFSTAFFNRYSLFTRLFPKNRWSKNYLFSDWNHSNKREIDWVSGCCMMLRKNMLNKIGLLDTQFFMYNEDVDICMRAKKGGWKVYYFPEAKIKHDIGGSSHVVEKKMIVERHKSMWRFYKKHYSKNIFVDILTFFVIFVRCSVKFMFSKT